MNYPQNFGPYVLLEKIGHGELSEVFKALDPQRGNRHVAIKRIKKESKGRKGLIQLLESEAQTLAKLHHPNLIEVHSFSMADGYPFIVMEYFDSFNLSAINFAFGKKDILIPIPHVCFIVKEVASALGYLHHQKIASGSPSPILHTDLAARNILIGRNGRIKLIDFSVAQAELNLARTGSSQSWSVLGDISPEMAEGKPLTERSDIYQLGLVLYKQLIGRSPYGEKTGQELYKTILEFDIQTHRFPGTLDQTLKEILLKALARKPLDRYSSAHLFEKALTNYLHQYYPGFGLEQMARYVEMAIYPSKVWSAKLQRKLKIVKTPKES